eukprot:3690594-Prymnesium_polylepis.1
MLLSSATRPMLLSSSRLSSSSCNAARCARATPVRGAAPCHSSAAVGSWPRASFAARPPAAAERAAEEAGLGHASSPPARSREPQCAARSWQYFPPRRHAGRDHARGRAVRPHCHVAEQGRLAGQKLDLALAAAEAAAERARTEHRMARSARPGCPTQTTSVRASSDCSPSCRRSASPLCVVCCHRPPPAPRGRFDVPAAPGGHHRRRVRNGPPFCGCQRWAWAW